MEDLIIALWFVGIVLLMKDINDWFSSSVFFVKTTDTFEIITLVLWLETYSHIFLAKERKHGPKKTRSVVEIYIIFKKKIKHTSSNTFLSHH